MRPTRPLPLLAAPLCCLALGACATDRQLLVETTPPGALVRLDDEELGTTPLEVPFVHYGTRKLTLELEGHLLVERDLVVDPPWYLRFPLDLVTEVLLPFGWEDHRAVAVALVPVPATIAEDEYETVRARAEVLRTAGGSPPAGLPPRGEVGEPLVAEPR